MKKLRLPIKYLIWMFSGVCVFLVFLALCGISDSLIEKQYDQQAAKRWNEEKGVAQVSAFFSKDSEITVDQIRSFEGSLNSKLEGDSIFSTSANPEARLWADTYSASGMLSVSTDRTTMNIKAIGVGGDFFLFHPMDLVCGGYFSESDVNKDYCVVDTDTAWQLFGSNDICGMILYVGKKPLMISGVVERPKGKLKEAAGLKNPVIYVSYDMLAELLGDGSGAGPAIEHFEIVMPNPISEYAKGTVSDLLSVNEEQVQYIENTKRFSFVNSVVGLKDYFTRSMNGKAIIYPYWENLARGYEDIISLITFFKLVLIGYIAVLFVVLVCIYWKNKKWTFYGLWIILKDKLELALEQRRAKKAVTVDDLLEGLEKPEEEKKL